MTAPHPDLSRWSAHHSGRHRLSAARPLVVEPIGLELERLSRPLDWRGFFGNRSPVEIEIGLGRGTFLTGEAEKRPDVNFLGVEWSRAFWKYACDRLRRHACWNARCVHAEALLFLREFVPDSSVSVVHVYFPDPWPKKRHHKRRLVQPPFVREVERLLAPGGRLQVVTDHWDYFQQIDRVLGESSLARAEFASAPTAEKGELAGTNFERKYRRQGRSLWAVAAVKRS